MENLSESDANVLQTFGRGQGIVSGQAVRFPLLVKVRFDADLVSDAIGDEDFIAEANAWQPDTRRAANAATVRRHAAPQPPAAAADGPANGRNDGDATGGNRKAGRRNKPAGRRGRIRPEGF
jgi:hypothetical protein